MNTNERIEQRIQRSVKECKARLIKPLEKILDGKIIQVEGLRQDVAEALDITAGMDLLLKQSNGGVIGIASRIQPGKDWQTFTVRRSIGDSSNTEYAKRKYSIANDCLYPQIALQAYVNHETGITSMGIAKTKDIIACIDAGRCTTKEVFEDGYKPATMFVVRWWDMIRLGLDVHRYRIDDDGKYEQMA